MALAITEGTGEPAAELARWAGRLAAAGVDAIQLREKTLSDADRLERAQAIAAALSGASTRLLINARFDIALATQATGVHLPEQGVPTGAVRQVLGPEALIGRSAHGVETVRRARDDGADYVTLGPIYDTPSKRRFGAPLGLAALEQAAMMGIAVLAIGGVTVARLSELSDAGARGVAAIRLFQTEGSELATTIGRIAATFGGA